MVHYSQALVLGFVTYSFVLWVFPYGMTKRLILQFDIRWYIIA